MILAVPNRLGRANYKLGDVVLAFRGIFERYFMPDPAIAGEHSLAVKAVIRFGS